MAKGKRRGGSGAPVEESAAELAACVLMAFVAAVFLALQIYFWAEGDPHAATLMCGMCLLCCGVCAGWEFSGKARRGGDGE